MARRFPRILAVTGMAFEARIVAGFGVETLCGGGGGSLRAQLDAAIAKGCRGIVSFGIAGGLAAHLAPGAGIVARGVVTTTGRIDCHPEWNAQLLRALPAAIHADIVGVRAPVVTPQDKRELTLSSGAGAVDMESLFVAEAAAAHGLPFSAIRVVADPCERALPPAARIPLRADGRPDLPAVMQSILAQPGQVGALIRVAKDVRIARAALADARRRLDLPGLNFPDVRDELHGWAPAAL
jgi:adenosylhomocysteine nucleosidase